MKSGQHRQQSITALSCLIMHVNRPDYPFVCQAVSALVILALLRSDFFLRLHQSFSHDAYESHAGEGNYESYEIREGHEDSERNEERAAPGEEGQY
jgi:hypothetical protein